jgi:hypothetical protein
MGKRGDKRRAKDRAKQRAESQHRRITQPDPDRTAKPDPQPARPAKKAMTRPPLHTMDSPGTPGAPKSPPPGEMTPEKWAESKYMSMEWPPTKPGGPSIQLLLQITKKAVNLGKKTLEVQFTPVEDTIHPRPLPFDPPLQQYGKDGTKAFRHTWEKLDYVFGLPDPYAFREIPILEQDREGIERYVKHCRRFAGFSTINDDTTLSVTAKEGPNSWRIRVVNYPSDESFMGTSAAFRQIHNEGEVASFMHAFNALFKAMKKLPEEQRDAVKNTALQWRNARGKLMNHTLQTLTALKAGNATFDNPVSYGNVNPDELIRIFNYGDSLHFGDFRGQLDDLIADEHHEAYYKYAALLSIVGLSHLYFGFAVLLDRALGGVA